jgi:hypothetical protein
VAAQGSGAFSSLSTPREIKLILDFCQAMVILGMHASYRRMEMGPTTQRIGVVPDQGAREKGGPDSVLDRSELRSN